ncbi:PrpF domain-containing protein [Microbacterium arborescens]|uniref:PrpF domain-containing protein n=1 Tax=Microbacterium arborescens TaxID=33883 RepID=UPI00278B35B3|nr:PrpF domain-containing protein [Microbacterium arborescens]MDQ1215864.1 2-methylaconitate cis-trans-isomerase PrpF [Microbacterium arborescens]
MLEIPATLMRGGTSKCWVFSRDELERVGAPVDDILLRLYGSPDERQIDGLGGGTSTTSKAVILAPSRRDDADIDYTFAQVGLADGRVDWSSNCGNCSAAVAPFALHAGWLQPQGDRTSVRIFNTNTGQLIVAEVPTPGGMFDESGDARIVGVPFAGLEVVLWFVDPAGRTTGRLLPSGVASEEIDGVPVTLIDGGAPVVIAEAAALGLTGLETPAEIDARPELLARIDGIRREGAVRMGLASTAAAALKAVPKVALVSPRSADDHDFGVTMMSMGKAHPAIAITGSVALTLAAATPGTVVSRMAARGAPGVTSLRTPSGVVSTRIGRHGALPAVGITRSARRLADASVTLPLEQLPDHASGLAEEALLVR